MEVYIQGTRLPLQCRGPTGTHTVWVGPTPCRVPENCLLTVESNVQRDRVAHTVPHGGVRPFHQKSTCITQLTSGPSMVQIWSRIPQNSGRAKPSNSTVRELAEPFWHICVKRLIFTSTKFSPLLKEGPGIRAGGAPGRIFLAESGADAQISRICGFRFENGCNSGVKFSRFVKSGENTPPDT